MESLFGPEGNNKSNSKPLTEQEKCRIQFLHSFRRLEAYIQLCPAKVKEYIDKHPLEQKNTDFFAELTEIDRKILQKVFKEQNQVTISEYQLQKRMEVAATLLQECRLTQKQIASKCGYHNSNNFSRAFKKVFKLSPKFYLINLYQQSKDSKDIKKD